MECTRWGAIAVGVAWVTWEGVKWGVAIFTAPETCGGSLAGAASTP
jgi:hypothetical protein